MNYSRRLAFVLLAVFTLIWLAAPQQLLAQESAPADGKSVPELLDSWMGPVAEWAAWIVFFETPVPGSPLKVPVVLIILAGTAVFLTVFFGFINLRAFGIAIRTARGKYTPANAPGQITHFQALTAALSATVGLGNIAGVAVAVGLGGPGATFWMILMGLCGMTTKFAECTLGVKYRKIDHDGRVHGGAMYYLTQGLKERGVGWLGWILGVMFAIMVIGGAFGAGNMFQANQAFSQFQSTWTDLQPGSWLDQNLALVFGSVMAVLVGMVILGGIVWIARVTSFLVPVMCIGYVATGLVIILTNIGEVGPAFAAILTGAFSGEAVAGGIVGALIQGIRRAAFSNESGLGSAPIAHSAVKTDQPASEGFVALLEPFVDTVVVCTVTALVLVITGTWRISAEVTADGAELFSQPSGGQLVQQLDAGQFVHTRYTSDEDDGKWLEVISLVSREDPTEGTEVQGWVRESETEDKHGVHATSRAFEGTFSIFPKFLSIAVLLFAFSTMISWSYYGEQGVNFLFSWMGEKAVRIPVVLYKIVFCLVVILGASASLGNVLTLSDSMVFAMVFPNLIGLYILLPVVNRERRLFLERVREIDGKSKS